MESNKNKSKKTDKSYNADITKQDLNKLGERTVEQRTDHKGDDVQFTNRERPVDFTGKELDVPGRNIPSTKATNTNKLKDEENQLYSQGSGHNDHLEDSENHE
ncbi:hypothetical protein [Winogradskyella bathintestinalis]|uniref:Uncharacterized protein n=1 Tax=Winogradskyella bathintestinalis TaxID=3035208 RepID=A0ABT7ZX58_9FLAO|nr:hypothetical protein [Winogradskyella bathintestinalis]MDN3493595.1 hypothetical protein [Winogradskyella bathintestinalis]